MANKTKLELTWIGKDERPRLEPRILIEQPELSYHAQSKREGDHFDNKLIYGDNLLALKALETDPTVRGQVKCIFIDPPYNTGSAFEHYDDGIEHSLWLSMMRDRLEILCNLLSENGSIWISIDDNEAHYLKVLCDEVFGRKNFLTSLAWQKVFAKKNKALISSSHDHILVYAKNALKFERNLLLREGASEDAFKNPDNDARGPWQSVSYTVKSEDSEKRQAYRYPIKLPSGREVLPPQGRHWNGLQDRTESLRHDNRLWFGKDGDKPPRLKTFRSEVQEGIVPDTWWTHEFAGNNQDSKKEVLLVVPEAEPFGTPKPEKLLSRIIHIATNSGDLVLDSFAGSGTTGAVAHKMGRRWIMVELGEHAKTHIVPRLKKVIDGSDKGGITEAVNWQGGGGFRFYKLAPSMLEKDKWGNLVINKSYNAEMLAEAMCKHFNYSYAPSTEHYWMHGFATENAFIYVTTNSLTFEQLKAISDEVGESRSLLVCCMAYEAAAESLTNLTLKKIPRVVLGRCEWGQDDYSLKIAALPEREAEPEEVEAAPSKAKKTKKVAGNIQADQASLFDGAEE